MVIRGLEVQVVLMYRQFAYSTDLEAGILKKCKLIGEIPTIADKPDKAEG